MATSSVKERLQADIKAQGDIVRKLKQEKRPQDEVGKRFSCFVVVWPALERVYIGCVLYKFAPGINHCYLGDGCFVVTKKLETHNTDEGHYLLTYCKGFLPYS